MTATVPAPDPADHRGRIRLPTRIHRAARRITGRLGTHGYGLLSITFLWVVVGIGVLHFGPPTDDVSGWTWLIVRTVAWWGGALLCLSAAIDREGPRRDAFALGFATTGPVMDTTLYAYSWAKGNPDGWFWAAVHLAFFAFAILVAAIRDDQ